MEKTDKEVGKKERGSTSFKIKKLQKQYNKILCELFEKYAPESIEEALESSQGSFGENIVEIVSNAAENLKSKILDELGVETGVTGDVGIGGIAFEIGGGDNDEEQGADIFGMGSESGDETGGEAEEGSEEDTNDSDEDSESEDSESEEDEEEDKEE